LVPFLRSFRLDHDINGLGMSCDADGVHLAGVPLLHKSERGFVPRPVPELQSLADAAYGAGLDASAIHRGLKASASALNRGDIGIAMMAALHLRLPDLEPARRSRLTAADERLRKSNFNPAEPRDAGGQWATGGGGLAGFRGKPAREADDEPSDTDEPPAERNPMADPELQPKRPPAEWEKPDGERVPVEADGRLWPEATYQVVRRVLATRLSATEPAQMAIFVPIDGKGPLLVGSDENGDRELPDGYAKVMFFGTPQVTRAGGVETGHADDSVQAALTDAATNRFSSFYFNMSFRSSTQGVSVSYIRPDVLAVYRPSLDLPFAMKPYESLSPGQTLPARQLEMPTDLPGLEPVTGQRYKLLLKLLKLLGFR
jgi:hypothetical protein